MDLCQVLSYDFPFLYYRNRAITEAQLVILFLGDDMKKTYENLLLAFVLSLVIPLSVIGIMSRRESKIPEQKKVTEITEKVSVEIPVLMADGEIDMLDLDAYLTGVVLAEMPARFEKDALKAQAVVARTYTMKRVESGDKHTGGAICTKPSCCQAYCSPEEYLKKGNLKEDLALVKEAVYATSGQVLLYGGRYIEATYFSCSGGRTEAAVAVWGSDIPYLQAVDSPGEEIADCFTDTASFSVNEFLAKLGAPSGGTLKIGKTTYTDGGGVATVEINGKSFSGTQVRQKLGLRSTAFTFNIIGNTVTVTTRGYGHRVGMSQYGAQAMALDGKSYQQILGYYYQGAVLGRLGNN